MLNFEKGNKISNALNSDLIPFRSYSRPEILDIIPFRDYLF